MEPDRHSAPNTSNMDDSAAMIEQCESFCSVRSSMDNDLSLGFPCCPLPKYKTRTKSRMILVVEIHLAIYLLLATRRRPAPAQCWLRSRNRRYNCHTSIMIHVSPLLTLSETQAVLKASRWDTPSQCQRIASQALESILIEERNKNQVTDLY